MTTFGGTTIPPIFSGSDSASGGGGGGGFTTAPINFLSQTLNFVLPGALNPGFQRSITFQVNNFESRMFQNSDANILPPNQNVPTQPQWHVNTPIANQGSMYQIAFIQNTGGNLPLSQFAFDNPPIANKWITINAFPGAQSADLRFFAPAIGTYNNIAEYQIRENFGANTVLAQAFIELTCLVTG